MTTDTKAVARWSAVDQDVPPLMNKEDDGKFVLFTDHEQVVANLNRKLLQMILGHQELRTALAAKSAEVEGLRRGWSEVKHSIQQANVPGNDWKRELKLISNIVDAAMEKSNEHQDQ